LAGAFRTNFWLEAIFPLVEKESSVRNAVIALSSMHEHYSGIDHFAPANAHDFALNYYGKAMREIASLTQSQSKRPPDHALVTCSLFSTLESLQGHYHESCKHAIYGIKILAEEQKALARKSPEKSRAPTDVELKEGLARFFIASGRQILELGEPCYDESRNDLQYTRSSIPMPEKFTSHENAILHMEILLAEVVEYCDRADSLAGEGLIAESAGKFLISEFQVIKEHFDNWKAAFEAFTTEMIESRAETPESVSSDMSGRSIKGLVDAQRSPATLVLQAYYSLVGALMARIERNDISVLDEYDFDFWVAVNACEEFINTTSTYTKPVRDISPPAQNENLLTIRPTFSLALGVVPLLFLAASRTSDIALREKALHLLRTCNRREGLWDSRIAAKLIIRMYELRNLAAQLGTRKREEGVFSQNVASRYSDDSVEPLFSGSYLSPRTPASTENRPSSPSHEAEPIFNLLDIKFLPEGRCSFRYTFYNDPTPPGETALPGVSKLNDVARGTRQYARVYEEEIR
jgi:hypothetical protein